MVAKMMLSTGNRKGLTFFEIMVALAVLSFGLTLIYQAFLTSLNTFHYHLTHLQAQCWMAEKIWEVEDDLLRKKRLGSGKRSGNLLLGNKNIAWRMEVDSISATEEFYQLNLTLLWQEGQRKITVTRTVYAGI